MPLVRGATAAGFNIVRQLGYEEFGELYVADHPRLPRRQVLHLIPAEASVDLDYRERFTCESDQAATLWHPSIAGLTDRGEFDDQLWIATEYIEGSDAAQLVAASHPEGMPPRLVVEIVSAIADALDYAHDRGVLHRYVNPGNILVGHSSADRRRIALTGFGVARPDGARNTLTRAGMFIGTAGYTAPEQLTGEEIDGRADQYALAASAFHLLTGTPPFAHFNPSVVVSKQLNERPPRPSDVRPDLVDFDAIFARALAQDPVDRFRRCRDFAKALESTGGTRSHIRTTSKVRAASISRDADDETATTRSVPAPKPEDRAPGAPTRQTEPRVPRRDPVPKPEVLADNDAEASSTTAAPVKAPRDVESQEASRRRVLQFAAIGGVIAVVLVAWFVGVTVLRSASRPDDAGTNVETTPTESSAPPPAVIAPPPPPLPAIVSTPVATTTATPTTRSTSRPTTTATTPRTTVSSSSRPTSTPSTPPSGLDTRPAVGMPCGPDQTGAAAVSNSGGPVNCVSTPGGFAWEPPGA
jgi:serine/threonine-protein kinase